MKSLVLKLGVYDFTFNYNLIKPKTCLSPYFFCKLFGQLHFLITKVCHRILGNIDRCQN